MSGSRMRRSRWACAWLPAAVAFAQVSCAPTEEADAATEDSAATSAVRVINVEVTPVTRGAFTDFIRIAGRVEAFEDVVVSADESGVLERYLVERGDRVRAGEPLVRLNADVLEAEAAEARASAALAKEQYARRRQLWEVEHIGTEIAYLQAKYEAKMAEARLANLEARLARSILRAPITGVFEEKYLEAGERADVGDAVLRVVTISPIKVVGGVPERLAPFIQEGNRARLTFDVFGPREFGGRINFVGSTVNPQNRTFLIEIVIANPEGIIKPEMIANIQVVRARADSVVVIPQTAVVRGADGYHVFVVSEADRGMVAQARPVTLGTSYENRVVVEAGLEVGDLLITTGQQLVDAGSRVRVVPSSTDSAEEPTP